MDDRQRKWLNSTISFVKAKIQEVDRKRWSFLETEEDMIIFYYLTMEAEALKELPDVDLARAVFDGRPNIEVVVDYYCGDDDLKDETPQEIVDFYNR